MDIKRALLGAVLGMSLCACVASDEDEVDDGVWRTQSDEINDITCERVYECLESAELAMMQNLAPELGQSAAECQENMRQKNQNATQPCQPGESYHADLAEQCIAELPAIDCADFKEWLPYGGPASCRQVCS